MLLKPVKTIFHYAIETRSEAEVGVEEFERESEEMQEEPYDE